MALTDGMPIRLKIVIVGKFPYTFDCFIFLGDGNTGKTVLLHAYQNKGYEDQHIPTGIHSFKYNIV